MNHPTDSELVEWARERGDKQAFGMLLERYQTGAFRMAKRLIAHEETARELTQEAMLQAYLSLSSLQQPQRFQSWLYGIVINLCRSYLRQQHDNPLSIEAISGGLDATPVLLVSHAPDPQTMAEMRELHEFVLAAIETLSPQNRQATLLYYYEQLSLREIGSILGISMTAVKGRLHKSRRQLATYFTTFASREPWFSEQLPLATGGTIQERKPTMIEVQLVDVIIPEDDKQNFHVVILLDEKGQRVLPIWVGPFEANSIAMYLLDEKFVPRPMTYDFMANLLKATGAVLEEIQISSLQESTYYATALLRVGDTVQPIDARPSDAMAIALRMKSKIFVADEVIAKAGMTIPDKYRDKMPRKGLEELAARMEKAKQEQLAIMAKFKEKAQAAEDPDAPRDRLFVHLFGE